MKKLFNKTNLLAIGFCLFIFLFSYLIHINLGIPFFLILLYLCFYKRFTKNKAARLLNLNFLFLISFCLGYYLINQGLSFYFIPVTIIPMLCVLLFNNPGVAYFLSLTTSIALASLSPEPFKACFLFVTSCICAILLVDQARKRSQVIRAGIIAGALQLVGLILLEHFRIAHTQRYLVILINGLLSGIITLGILPFFEYILQTVTNISLLELADFNQPILQRMILEAPGTYHHSLVVGNLSDSACSAVGANGLLARIGAYYHDIGKLQKPDYFIENQDINKNAHDELTPTMSKLIIMNHIKEGLELAKKYHLSPILWDFIQQHHGNSLVYYFYRRALEGKEENQEVSEEGFRYPGPKPNTKETAIVLLADSVEAATRSLKDPAPDKIEETVHKVINNKFIDGQLDECDLTLKDIEKISIIFIRILSGIYHSRVNYPQN
ncbi:MAG TPA: HDIG domain-containing protein [Candidatus Omnitrophota bacterium]|nr:HDIG domain-containing protein [Candidatus Omnitrophota bacterium]HPT38865.1 HDIG domain-containing protein [Candidatus Omnitrophota bacterium]